MKQPRSEAGCSPVPLDPLVGLESADMDIVDRLHGYALLHKGMTPESWAMAEGRDEIVGLRQIVAAQRDLIAALEQVADLTVTAMAENARSVFDVAQIERTLKVLAAAKAACLTPNRDRKKPHGPSLPHHRTNGSRIRRFDELNSYRAARLGTPRVSK